MNCSSLQLAALSLILSGFALADDSEAPDATIGFQAGEKMPFFVVDFCYGQHKDHAGCPGVMVANAQAKGLIVIAHQADAAVIEFVKSLAPLVDGKSIKGHFIVLATDEADLAARCERAELKQYDVGIPRTSGKQLLGKLGLSEKVALALLLTDGKAVKQTHLLAAGELTDEKQQELRKTAAAFADHAADK